ncbi:hypothetical protein F4678DRAFT_459505 [Xylaria arbuscula]|nr:hypothetical protein F4678DRAFT_459505 [Xylaria arbuscula]
MDLQAAQSNLRSNKSSGEGNPGYTSTATVGNVSHPSSKRSFDMSNSSSSTFNPSPSTFKPSSSTSKPPSGTSTPSSTPSKTSQPPSRIWILPSRDPKTRRSNGKAPVVDHHTPDTPTYRAPFTPARSFYDPAVPTSTRKISASFSTDCPLSGHPTIACSAVTASTTMNRPRPPSHHQINNRPSALSSSQSYRNIATPFTADNTLKASHTYSNLPMPTVQYKASSSRPSIATAYTNVRALPVRKVENIPPSPAKASGITKKQGAFQYPTPKQASKLSPSKNKTKSRLSISKSRTFNVFSNLTASLSRTSLGQLTSSDSRRTSTSSKTTTFKDPTPYMNSQSASSTSSQALPNPRLETTNPRQIHTAQSSAYWAGRFMALQDRFQSEVLVPENLASLVHVHAERSLLAVTQPSLASSATTSCITSTAGSNNPNTTRRVTESTSPRKRQQQLISESRAPSHILPRKISCSTAAANRTITVAPPRPSHEVAAAMLVDDDHRCRRIFMHLDGLCTTSEARHSLQQWQQSYARRTGKKHLCVTPQKKTKELTWVGRLLMGGGGGHAKRGSLGL